MPNTAATVVAAVFATVLIMLVGFSLGEQVHCGSIAVEKIAHDSR